GGDGREEVGAAGTGRDDDAHGLAGIALCPRAARHRERGDARKQSTKNSCHGLSSFGESTAWLRKRGSTGSAGTRAPSRRCSPLLRARLSPVRPSAAPPSGGPRANPGGNR